MAYRKAHQEPIRLTKSPTNRAQYKVHRIHAGSANSHVSFSPYDTVFVFRSAVVLLGWHRKIGGGGRVVKTRPARIRPAPLSAFASALQRANDLGMPVPNAPQGDQWHGGWDSTETNRRPRERAARKFWPRSPPIDFDGGGQARMVEPKKLARLPLILLWKFRFVLQFRARRARQNNARTRRPK